MGTFIPRLREFEKSLWDKHRKEITSREIPIIAIGGFSGTGKDTVAFLVQSYCKENLYLLLNIVSAGELIRKIAVESGWKERNLDEFMKHIQSTQNKKFAETIDLEIEKRALRKALLEGGIFVGRMAPYTIGTHGITIWLEVAAKIIANRISNDPNRSEYGMEEEELIKRIQSRDKTDADRLEQIYGISFRDRKKFDLTLRNEGYSLEELSQIIKKLLDKKCSYLLGKKKDES